MDFLDGSPYSSCDDVIAFGSKVKYSVIEVIEELKVKRKLLLENDQHIKRLLSEKCDLQTLKDALSKQLGKLEENKYEQPCSADKTDLNKQQNIEMETYKTEIATMTKELTMLKEELKRLRMEEHRWQTREREMQSKVNLCNSGKEECAERISSVDALSKMLKEELERLKTLQQKLGEDVSEAINQNVAAKNAIDHHRCVAEHYEELCSRLKKELVEAQAQLKMKNSESKCTMAIRATNREDELGQLREENAVLQTKLQQVEESHKKTIEMLTQSTKMLRESSCQQDPRHSATAISIPEYSVPSNEEGSAIEDWTITTTKKL